MARGHEDAGCASRNDASCPGSGDVSCRGDNRLDDELNSVVSDFCDTGRHSQINRHPGLAWAFSVQSAFTIDARVRALIEFGSGRISGDLHAVTFR